MMKRNKLCTSIVVTCDAGCGLCWVYDCYTGATFKAAAERAAAAGWAIIRRPTDRRELCMHCGASAGVEAAAAA